MLTGIPAPTVHFGAKTFQQQLICDIDTTIRHIKIGLDANMPGDLAETYTFPAAPASQSEMEKDLTPPTEEAQNKVEGEPIAGSQQVLNLEKAASESEEGKSEEELPELYQKDTPKASLVESVREFVQRLEQWKHLLPTSLSEDAAALKSHTDDMRLLEEPVPHPPK